MSSKLIIIFLLILTALLGGYYFLGDQFKTQNNPIYPNPVNSKTLNLPVNPNDPGIESVRVLYAFKGKLTDVMSSGSSLTLKLDSNNPEFPVFTTNANTGILHQTKDHKIVEGSLDEVRVGQNVVLSASYLLREKNWLLEIILIQD